jgi:hypothetical protein
MESYLRRARQVLADFDGAASGAAAAIGGLPPSPKLSQKQLGKLQAIAARLPEHTARIRFALDLTEKTAVDVVDLQARFEGLTAALAADLATLGDGLEKSPEASASGAGALLTLDEQAERVASAIFPNAIEGLHEINRTLWDFRPIALEYSRTFAAEVARTGKNRMTNAQIETVRETADTINTRFSEVNELLNQLAVSTPGNGATIKSMMKEARQALEDAVKSARARATEAYKPFHGALGRIERLAGKIDGQFDDLRVPVFPVQGNLEDLEAAIDAASYLATTGVERMALLNIAARLKSIAFGAGPDEHLLSGRFRIRIFDLYPSRIYFSTDVGFIDAIARLEQGGTFEAAPASLHRFRDGSYKQTTLRKGNLQVSFAAVPGEPGRVNVDADIDLYRSPLRHLFGEVLVNHLTGRTTDQFKVFDILAAAAVMPIGAFAVVTA